MKDLKMPFKKDFERQEIYYGDKKGKRFGHKWGPSSVPTNFMNLMCKL